SYVMVFMVFSCLRGPHGPQKSRSVYYHTPAARWRLSTRSSRRATSCDRKDDLEHDMLRVIHTLCTSPMPRLQRDWPRCAGIIRFVLAVLAAHVPRRSLVMFDRFDGSDQSEDADTLEADTGCAIPSAGQPAAQQPANLVESPVTAQQETPHDPAEH